MAKRGRPSGNGKSVEKSVGRTQPGRNGGTLKVGGDHPRPGRPSNELRGSLREILEVGLPHLKEFALGRQKVTEEREVKATCPECGTEVSAKIETEVVAAAKPADQLRAIETAARYGLTAPGYDQSLVDQLFDALQDILDEETLDKVRGGWAPILAQRLIDAAS